MMGVGLLPTASPSIRSTSLCSILADDFLEIAAEADACRFANCAHIKEQGCAVLAAVERGTIADSRYRSYCAIYETL